RRIASELLLRARRFRTPAPRSVRLLHDTVPEDRCGRNYLRLTSMSRSRVPFGAYHRDRGHGAARSRGMRVYISVDMEGIGGISHFRPTERGDLGYPAACELMTGEANAAIEGALLGGATDILVNDSHGGMYNLSPIGLHSAARLLQGQKAWSMVAGAMPAGDGGAMYDVALFVGYHARAGHPTGTI